jgi:hypothetical protein
MQAALSWLDSDFMAALPQFDTESKVFAVQENQVIFSTPDFHRNLEVDYEQE